MTAPEQNQGQSPGAKSGSESYFRFVTGFDGRNSTPTHSDPNMSPQYVPVGNDAGNELLHIPRRSRVTRGKVEGQGLGLETMGTLLQVIQEGHVI